jgi:hypothetical protein
MPLHRNRLVAGDFVLRHLKLHNPPTGHDQRNLEGLSYRADFVAV